MNKNETQIKLLQDNLKIIRKMAGWTSQDLGDLIGLTKQSISNFENKKTEMNLTQYISIRLLIDYKIQEDPSNEILVKFIDLIFKDQRVNIGETWVEGIFK